MVATIGQPIPVWQLPELVDASRHHQLSDYLGKVVVVLFWAANPLCKRYQRYLDGFFASYRPRGVAMFGIVSGVGDTPKRLQRVVGKLPDFPVLQDRDGEVARAYGVTVAPTVYVADGEGVLRYWGAIDDRSFGKLWPDENYLEEAVECLLLETDVPDPHNPPVGYPLKVAFPT